jgi:Tol biopolymer transport system component
LAGCGRVGFDSSVVSTDGAIASRAECWDRWKTGQLVIGAPRKLAELGTGKLANPSISTDGATLYVERVDANEDLFAAERTGFAEAWSTASRLEALATTAREARLSTSGDGMLGVFTSNRSGNSDLWITQRDTPDGTFGAPTQTLVAALKTTKNELDPELTMDGRRIYYAPYDGTNQEIRVAQRELGGNFAFVRTLSELQISIAVADPSLSPDETVIAFSSGATEAQNELYYATRPNRDAQFGTPQKLPSVNISGINDGDIDVSADGCEIYFASTRDGSTAIYLALVDN